MSKRSLISFLGHWPSWCHLRPMLITCAHQLFIDCGARSNSAIAALGGRQRHQYYRKELKIGYFWSRSEAIWLTKAKAWLLMDSLTSSRMQTKQNTILRVFFFTSVLKFSSAQSPHNKEDWSVTQGLDALLASSFHVANSAVVSECVHGGERERDTRGKCNFLQSTVVSQVAFPSEG